MLKRTLKNMWVCYGVQMYPDYSTMSYTKKDSIRKCLEYSSLTWKQWQKQYGWKCVKMNVTFEEIGKKEL